MYLSVYHYAAVRLGTGSAASPGFGSCARRDFGRLLPGRNGKQRNYLHCRRRCAAVCGNDHCIYTDRAFDDTVSGVCARRCVGRGFFSGNGNFRSKGYFGSGITWNFNPKSVWKTDSEDFRCIAFDFCCIYCYDYFRNRGKQQREDCKLWTSCAWSGYAS